jgi:fermentation-respiration switch protein FrsA (DUF1100 family)
VTWLWIVLGVLGGLLALCGLFVLWLHRYLTRTYLDVVVRIFQEKPLFVIPRGQPVADGEEVSFPNTDGLTLRGLYLRTTAAERKGVVLFGLEFGSNRWSAVTYCDFLRRAGFDVFTFEPRSQGDSDRQPGYDPLQWVTDFEVKDFQAALAYLHGRPDADPRGVGLFGISKGAGAGVLAATGDPSVRCCVTDGMFATHTTMVPYMRKWIAIYSKRRLLQKLLPTWVYGLVARAALKRIQRERGCRFPHLERRIKRLGGRPLLMIHGGGDTYIKPEMARSLFDRARGAKEFWLVEGAKHNQAFHVAGGEYQRRALAFFCEHLAGERPPAEAPSEDPAEGEKAAAQGRADLVTTR